MKGKDKCKILKEIRQKIANENDIPFVTSECKHQGDCRGTCPKCESELIYLENELAKRKTLGKRIALAGLVATFTIAGTSCDFGQTITSTPKGHEVDGDMAVDYVEPGGAVPLPPENDELQLLDSTLVNGEHVFDSGVTLPEITALYELNEEQILSLFGGIERIYFRSAYRDAFISKSDTSDEFHLRDDQYMELEYDENGIFMVVTLYQILATPGDPA